jgi:hypothetical protein
MSSSAGPVAILIYAIGRIELAGGCITYTEAGGVLDDDPGVKQATKFKHADYQKEQNRQYQGKFQHALGFCFA